MSALRLNDLLRRTGLLGPAMRVRERMWALRFRRVNATFLRRGAPDGLPIPPLTLRIAVAASPDIAWFLESGRRAADSIRAALTRAGMELARLQRLLDFGCGCGRVVRNWSGLPTEIHGCDVDPRLVSWCREHLSFGHFAVNGVRPPLGYPDEMFDLVYALSVFTHLPAALQGTWIAELRRVLRPGGWLLITTHGTRYLNELTRSERLHFEAGDLVVRHEELAGTNACGAYHPPAWVRSRLTKGLEIVEHVPEGAAGNPWQDLYLLRRP